MTRYRQWHDFAVVPKDPERISSESERLNISKAGRSENPSDELPDIYRVVWNDLSASGRDSFEAMEITPTGGVVVWTNNHVWTVFSKFGLEKLVCVPRHPPVDENQHKSTSNRLELVDLFDRNRARLQGIDGWQDVARLGKTNLRRLQELLAEEAIAAASTGAPLSDRREWAIAVAELRHLSEQAIGDKPCLPRLRVETFRVGDRVSVFLGDTPTSLQSGWVGASVTDIKKAYNSAWNDGSANAGYYWELTVQTDSRAFSDGQSLHCSTSEPRVIPVDEYASVVRAIDSDPEFFRIFVNNAQRSWNPLWCLERSLQISPVVPDVRAWFKSP